MTVKTKSKNEKRLNYNNVYTNKRKLKIKRQLKNKIPVLGSLSKEIFDIQENLNDNKNRIEEVYNGFDKKSDYLNYRIDELYQGLERKINNDLYKLEKELFNMYKLLENRIWDFNRCTNIIIYENHLKKLNKKNNFKPKVSIIIPVYNGANYMKEAINSALAQTYKNIEIIVVNDGSNDNGKTRKIAQSYGNKIKYFEKENGGVSSALNFGIKKMNGEYFSWLSHDDLIDKNHIEKLIEYLSYEGTDYHIPYVNFKIIDNKSKIKFDKTVEAQLYCSDYKISLIKNNYTLLTGEINGGSVLIPKKAFDEFGNFNEEERITQERDMWSRLIKKYKFINVPYDTASIRIHETQVTKNTENIAQVTSKKNMEIINNLKEEQILSTESSIDYFYKYILSFYKYNNNVLMQEKLEKLIENIKD